VKLFKHQALPHNVWVDKDGIIRAITGSDEITANNIQRFINGKDYHFTLKQDVVFDYKKHLHIEDSLIQYRSIFNTHLKNVNISGYYISMPGYVKPNMRRFYGWNVPIADLFWNAYAEKTGGGRVNPDLCEFHTNDPLSLYLSDENQLKSANSKYKTREEWNNENTYAYELLLPRPVENLVFYGYVIQDLQRIFNIRSAIKLEKRMCMVVKIRKKGIGLQRSLERNPHFLVRNRELKIENATIDDILNWISVNTYQMEYGRREPYLNKTGYPYPVNATIKLGQLSRENLQDTIEARLTALGFSFKKGIRRYPVLVLTDRK